MNCKRCGRPTTTYCAHFEEATTAICAECETQENRATKAKAQVERCKRWREGIIEEGSSRDVDV